MSNPFSPVINSLLPEPQASLLSGILFGIRSSIPKSLYQDLVTTGTLHIIALSGMNITILTNLIAKGTFFLGRKTSAVLSIISIIVFVCFVGATPSVVRAAIMGSMALLSLYFGRLNWSLLSLFLACLIMLFFNFSLKNDLSFQLSFLATLGIILANKRVKCQKNKRLFSQLIFLIKENFKLTLAAQLFTLPVILYNFRRISLIAPLANLTIEWIIQPVMVLGFIISLLGKLWLPLAIIPSWMTWVLLTYLIHLVESLAKIPGASISY